MTAVKGTFAESAELGEKESSPEEQAQLALMLTDDTPDPRRGRPPVVLYPSVAARALEELEVDRRSYGAVARRCRRTKPWLIAAHKSGRLKEMSEGRMGQPTGP